MFLAMHAEQEKRLGLVNANRERKCPAGVEIEDDGLLLLKRRAR